MEIVRKTFFEISKSEKSQIDIFIGQNNGLIFHEIKLNEIVSGIFSTELSYILAYINKKLVGICPVHTLKKGILKNSYSNNGSFEIPYGGWVFDKNSTEFQKLWNKFPLRFNESITYWSSLMSDIPGKIKKTGISFQTGYVNLDLSENEIFNSVIHSKRRNMIRKAEKSGITIIKYGTEGLPIYYNILQRNQNQTGQNKNSLNFYQSLIGAYFSTGNALLMIAYLEEQPLAGVIILGNKNVMHYWKGALMDGCPNLGQGELLQWESIKWAKSQSAKYYDLCVIEPERLPNIAGFKLDFAGETLSFFCIIKKTFSYKILNKIQNVFTV
jgi:hypothetical protein